MFDFNMFDGITFLAGVVATAFITAVIKKWHSRPHPAFDVLSININRKIDKGGASVHLDHFLITKIQDLTFFPKLNPTMSSAELNKWIEVAERAISANQVVVDFFQNLLDRPHLLPVGVDREQQRLSLLREWNIHADNLDRFCLLALINFSAHVPQLYRAPHPPEWAQERIGITSNSAYNLSEIDVEEIVRKETEVQGPVGVEDRLRRHFTVLNIFRRFWIHLNETDLAWLFTRARELAHEMHTTALEILSQVKTVAARHSPEFLRVELLCRNGGGRAYSVQPEAQLAVRLKALNGEFDAYSTDLELDAGEPQRTQGTRTISAGGADKLVFYSTTPLQLLTLTDRDGNAMTTGGDRLQLLYNEDVVRCRVAINVSGLGRDSWKPIVSEEILFGKGIGMGRRDGLRNAAIAAI